MARILIGIIAHRKPTGEFLPAKPICRDVPDNKAVDMHIPYGELAEVFAKKYKSVLAAKRHHENNNKKEALYGLSN